MPSIALRSRTMPSRGDDHSMEVGTLRVFSMAAIAASGTSRFISLCRDPRPYDPSAAVDLELMVARYSAAADETAEGRPGDEAGDHCCAPSAKPFNAAFRLLSVSIRKLAETTTGSPSATPCRTST